MIHDIEPILLTAIRDALIKEYPKVTVISEHQNKPSSFPCVMFYESNNSTFLRTTDNLGEHHAEVSYMCEMYANNDKRKRSIVKNIAAIVDEVLVPLGFTRMSKAFEYRSNDSTIAAITAVYHGIIGESPSSNNNDVRIYRR
nr:MAG TPA: hypothetical protein [Caudoviricetes sp.]